MDVLSAREETVLFGLLLEYVESLEPVGSKSLSERDPEGLSPASIRAILNRLEEKGFLMHRHASAGREPTDAAYRYFAERIRSHLDGEAEPDRGILERLASGGSFNGVVREAICLLSSATGALGFAATPALDEVRFRSLELISLTSERVLLIAVSQCGQVHERIISSPEKYDQETLRVYSNFLNQTFKGISFAEIRASLRRELAAHGQTFLESVASGSAPSPQNRAQPAREDLLGRALGLVAPFFLGNSSRRELFYDGVEQLVGAPGLQEDFVALKSLLGTLVTKSRILELLDGFTGGSGGMRVVIGQDWPDVESFNLSMIVCPYETASDGRGMIGVIGPKPMRYDRAIPIVSGMARCVAIAGTKL